MNLLLIVIFSLLLETAIAADPNAPHPHQGIIAKFVDPGPALLSPNEQAALLSGQPVFQQTRHNNIDRKTEIFDVATGPKTIWQVITSFQNYPEWIQEISETEIYVSE